MKVIFVLIIFLLFMFILPVLFGGTHFCYLPVEDNGPGTIGCFYSASLKESRNKINYLL